MLAEGDTCLLNRAREELKLLGFGCWVFWVGGVCLFFSCENHTA